MNIKNLYGECDTPEEIYQFYKKINTKNQESIENALNEMEILCKKYDRAECYVLYGKLYEKLFNINEAYKYYRKAIECNPKNAAYYAVLSGVYLQHSQFDDAIEISTYLIEHPSLKNYHYYVSKREVRLLASCCASRWEIAKEDIAYLPEDFVIYIYPVKGRITKQRIEKAIQTQTPLLFDE